MGFTHDTGRDSARERAWRAGRRRAALAALAALLIPLLTLAWGAPSLVDPSPDAVWPLRSLLAVEQFPTAPLPWDKYPEGWHLLAGCAEHASVEFVLDPAERAQLADLRARVTAGVAAMEEGEDASRVLLTLGTGCEELLWKLVIAGRVAALLFLLLLVLATAEVAMAACGPRYGWIAGLAIGLAPAVAHYAATLNTDVPALACCAAGWALLVARRSPPTLLRTLLAGAALGLACAIKDPYAAVVPGIALFAWRRGAGRASGRWPRLGALVAAAAASYVVASGMLRFETWRAHVRHLFAEGSQPFRQHPTSLAGAPGLLRDTLDGLLAAGGIAATAGLALLLGTALFRRRWRAFAWWSPGVAKLALFLFPVGYVYPRFTLPIVLCGAVALAWSAAHAVGSLRGRQRLAIAVLAVLWTAGEATAVVDAKWDDPRPRASAALAARRKPDEMVWICPQPWLFAPFPPLPGPIRWMQLPELGAALKQGEPPPRYVWLAFDRLGPNAPPGVLEAILKKTKMRVVERFDAEPSGRLANDPAGLLLPTVVLLEPDTGG